VVTLRGTRVIKLVVTLSIFSPNNTLVPMTLYVTDSATPMPFAATVNITGAPAPVRVIFRIGVTWRRKRFQSPRLRCPTSLERVTTDKELLPTLLAQEERLVFPYFDYEAGWELGSAMREAALAQNYPIAILIRRSRSEEHTSELQSLTNLVCRLLLEKK